MGKRVVMMAAAWLAGAAAAAVGVTAALSFLGTGLFGTSSRPMSQAQVVQKLAQVNSATPSPSPTHSSSPPPAGQSTPPGTSDSRITSGGTVFATCSGALVQMVSTPKLNYGADDLAAGPARSAWVTFKSGSAEVHVTVSCTGGKPVFRVTGDDHGGATTAPPAGGGGDDHGGGRGGGGGGNSGGGGGSGGGGHDG